MQITFFIYLSLILFAIGLMGLLFKRNAIIFILSLELMLNASNLLFVAFSRLWGNEIGLVWVFFVLVVAAVEATVGLALIINIFRSKESVDVDHYNSLKG